MRELAKVEGRFRVLALSATPGNDLKVYGSSSYNKCLLSKREGLGYSKEEDDNSRIVYDGRGGGRKFLVDSTAIYSSDLCCRLFSRW